mmetsp:Transcript_4657/g.13469  ORF Transcript_4657/g.13469 Transcript_4657/m.13469 type:complete len:98 (+) Transcript_4657:151-444(+)
MGLFLGGRLSLTAADCVWYGFNSMGVLYPVDYRYPAIEIFVLIFRFRHCFVLHDRRYYRHHFFEFVFIIVAIAIKVTFVILFAFFVFRHTSQKNGQV